MRLRLRNRSQGKFPWVAHDKLGAESRISGPQCDAFLGETPPRERATGVKASAELRGLQTQDLANEGSLESLGNRKTGLSTRGDWRVLWGSSDRTDGVNLGISRRDQSLPDWVGGLLGSVPLSDL